jgi:hypothetical protein
MTWSLLVSRFLRHYNDAGYPQFWDFDRNMDWYIHNCPSDLQLHTLNFLARFYLDNQEPMMLPPPLPQN